jgi:mannan endo-1,4-beta-mannosidase
MRRTLFGVGAAVLALVAATVMFVRPADAAVGLHISGRNIVEANGQTFVMRGVNHPHVWYTNQTSSFANIKALGANTVRVVLGSGKRWGPSTDVANVISLCKQNRMICVLEVHDTTGYPEEAAGAASLDEAVSYWISQKSALVGQENYVVINIGNEPIGNQNPSQWIDATANAIRKLRANGFEHLLMADAPNWGQDWTNTMRDNAQTVWEADSQHNTVFSVHMYSVYNTASTITSYFDAFASKGLPLVVGEFGWRFNAGEVDHETILAETRSRGIGYLAWSWSGNSDPILDMATSFDPNQLTTWGEIIFNGANGIKATAKEATIFGGTPTTSPTTASPSVSPTVSPSVSPTTTPTGGTSGCTATYATIGQWPGGFQAEVRVTARDSAIRGWTVTWTFGDGQSVNHAWNATVASAGASVTARNVSYNGGLGAGASTAFGFIGSWNGANGAPTLSCAAS